MDTLQGGTIALEHTYAIGRLRHTRHGEHLYEGLQDPFERSIWVHVLDLSAMTRPQYEAFFERLGQTAKQHAYFETSGILRVLDHGEIDEGFPFLITERIHAPSLHDVLEREGTLTPKETGGLIHRLAQLLEPQHRARFYHGGLHPQCVYLPQEEIDQACLGHFGLALDPVELALALGISQLPDEMVTRLAPEYREIPAQATILAMPRFGRTQDLYALGTIAYQCLCGQEPEAQGTITPLENFGVDPKISAVVMKAIDPAPDARWSSVRMFAKTLAQACDLEAGPLVPSPTLPPRATPATTPLSPLSGQGDPFSYHPDRRSAITALALAFLLLSNAAWALHTLTPKDDAPLSPLTGADAPPAPLTLETSPPSAQVFQEHHDGQRTLLGQTPFVPPPTQESMTLVLERPDRPPATVILDRLPQGTTLSVVLAPEEAPAVKKP